MIKLDSDFLEELGLASLPVEAKNSFLQHLYDTLEMRVGLSLAEQMSSEQLDEFERFIDADDQAGALAWLEAAFPDYRDTVQRHFAALKAETLANVDRILAGAGGG